MSAFANIVVGGVFHAAVLFLVAAGLQLVFGVQKIVNLACGSFYALGAYFGITLVNVGLHAGLPQWTLLPMLMVAGLLMAVVGPPIERLLRTPREANNLAALQARSPQIPLHKTAEVAARRLADHLRESGWTATIAEPDDVPGLYAQSAHETWHGVQHGSADYVAAYQVRADTALANTLAAIWSYPVREAWTALELTGAGDEQTLAVACAFHTDAPPAARGPLPGLISQAGNQRPALTALHPLSSQQLDGHVDLPEALLLARLRP